MKEEIIKIVEENAFAKALHIELLELEKGFAKGRMKVEADIINPYGSVHGGALYSLADIISGCAALTYDKNAYTVSGNMNYLRPAMDAEYVYCEVEKLRQGKQLAVYDVKLTNDTGKVLETGTFTFFIGTSTIKEK